MEGRGDHILLPSVIPATRCRVVITQREVLIRLGILSDAKVRQVVMVKAVGDTIQILEALGQDPCLQSRQPVRRQEVTPDQ